MKTVKRAIEINAGIAILPASTVVTESEENNWSPTNSRWYAQPSPIIHKKNRLLTPHLDLLLNL